MKLKRADIFGVDAHDAPRPKAVMKDLRDARPPENGCGRDEDGNAPC